MAVPETSSLPSDEASAAPNKPSEDPDSGLSPEVIDAIDPCELLTPSELTKFGNFEEPEPRFSGGARNCRWGSKRTSAVGDLPLINIDVRDNVGISGMPDLGGGLHHGQMAESGRKIAQTSKEIGCVLAMALDEGARVDVVVSGIHDQSCDMAAKLAEIIDPKLPLG